MKSKNIVKEETKIYKTDNENLSLEVRVDDETIWLTQKQMSRLFQKDVRTINEHIKNVFKEGELEEKSTIRNFRIVQKEGEREVIRNIEFYNLDVIISVGYRVKSIQGTKFRIWATGILREHILKKGVTNEERNLSQVIRLIGQVTDSYDLNRDEALGLIKVINDYSYALEVLDQYDHQKLKLNRAETKEDYKIDYHDATELIVSLKKKFGGSQLFGKEKDASFQSTLNTIYQTFGKKELYPSLEEKAAMLLYLAIKNHSFIDGNKRIAAALFIMYLARNNFLYSSSGEKRIADNALVALCLMIAESNPKEKEMMIKVVVNLINKNN